MASAVDSAKPQNAGDALWHSVQPEVQKYLEAVFAVAPFPEEYVRYRLHLATALPLPLIDTWFETRRQSSGRREEEANPGNASTDNSAILDSKRDCSEPESTHFSLFEPSRQDLSRPGAQKVKTSSHCITEEAANVGRALTMMQNAHQNGNGQVSSPSRLFDNQSRPHANGAATEALAGAMRPSNGQLAHGKKSAASKEDPAAISGSRFTESDLDAISSLVGLETITSTQQHCGSNSLYLFEQLTALDSLDLESGGSNKRRRTRHQHFWRNTDKLDPEERVYVPSSSIKPALRRREYVLPKLDISPEERTNAWTVCLTTRGVVSYLNKRISPLGVRMIRVLQSSVEGRSTALQQGTGLSLSAAKEDRKDVESSSPDRDPSLAQARTKRARSAKAQAEDYTWEAGEDPPYNPHSRSHSNSGVSEEEEAYRRESSNGQKQSGENATAAGFQDAAFEPIPRARKRKPG